LRAMSSGACGGRWPCRPAAAPDLRLDRDALPAGSGDRCDLAAPLPGPGGLAPRTSGGCLDAAQILAELAAGGVPNDILRAATGKDGPHRRDLPARPRFHRGRRTVAPLAAPSAAGRVSCRRCWCSAGRPDRLSRSAAPASSGWP
jgi:hypothetical protein